MFMLENHSLKKEDLMKLKKFC